MEKMNGHESNSESIVIMPKCLRSRNTSARMDLKKVPKDNRYQGKAMKRNREYQNDLMKQLQEVTSTGTEQTQ